MKSSTSRVMLPHPKLLKLAASNDTICIILTDLDFPVSSSMFISFSNPGNAAHFPNSQSILLRLTQAFVSNHVFILHRKGQIISLSNSDFEPREGLNVEWADHQNDQYNKSFPTMHSVLTPLVANGAITDLHLTYNPFGHLSPSTSWKIFEAILLFDNKKLETLHISGRWTRSTWIFIPDMVKDTCETTGEARFPALRSLHFDVISFNKISRNPVSNLVKFISWRTLMGHGIDSVKFTKCGGVRNKLHKLTRAGVAVDWDGKNFPMRVLCRGPQYASDPDSTMNRTLAKEYYSDSEMIGWMIILISSRLLLYVAIEYTNGREEVGPFFLPNQTSQNEKEIPNIFLIYHRVSGSFLGC